MLIVVCLWNICTFVVPFFERALFWLNLYPDYFTNLTEWNTLKQLNTVYNGESKTKKQRIKQQTGIFKPVHF